MVGDKFLPPFMSKVILKLIVEYTTIKISDKDNYRAIHGASFGEKAGRE